VSKWAPLTQDPLKVGLKSASDDGKKLFEVFVHGLNKILENNGFERIWYQPDTSNWPMRYFWMFHYCSQKRDFLTRLNFRSKHTIHIEFSHFGAKKPEEVEFLPDELLDRLEYKGFPPHVLITSVDDCKWVLPHIAEHFIRIKHHLDQGGKLPLRGCSHIEIALLSFLKKNDSKEWLGWESPDFLGRKEVDLSLANEKIAIEIQGDYWHKLPGQPERDVEKREILLSNGWSLIWAWESGINNGNFQRALDALEFIRSGNQFFEIKRTK